MPDLPYLMATNTRWPTANDWTWKQGRKSAGRASLAEWRAAEEKVAHRLLRTEARRTKHALFAAILQRDVTTCRELLRRNPVLLERHTRWGATPLALACALGDEPICSLLLELGASVTAADSVGATPLIMAASRGHAAEVAMLLDSKQGGNAGRTYLLRQCTRRGETALLAAAKGGHTHVVQDLLQRGADLSATDLDSVDALMMAAAKDRVGTMEKLLQAHGMDADRRDKHGRAPLSHAAAGGSLQAVQLLLALQPSIDVAAADSEGRTALHHACMGGNLLVVQELLQRGLELGDPTGLPALQLLLLACKAGHADVITWLVEDCGVGVSELQWGGRGSPMMAAVHADQRASVEALLALGANIDVRDSRGRTPLAWAAQHGLDGMVRLLAARGASLVATDTHGHVPRQLAYLAHHFGTEELLSNLAKKRMLLPDDAISSVM